jgi:predicted transcriptional regulator
LAGSSQANNKPEELEIMSTTKDEAINLISRLPDEVNWDDIMYEMYVKKKIELGIKAADEGRVVPHEEVKRMFSVE